VASKWRARRVIKESYLARTHARTHAQGTEPVVKTRVQATMMTDGWGRVVREVRGLGPRVALVRAINSHGAHY
jgi:hypothetical protein